jgi:hypothetical protein
MMQLSLKNQNLSCQVCQMREEDIGQVTAIDKQVFPTMLPPINYHNEFHNALAHYVVACSKEKVLEEPADRRNVPGVTGYSAAVMLRRMRRLS